MVTRTTKFEHPRDEQLDFMRAIKYEDWQDKFSPMAFQEEYSKHIAGTEQLEGTSSMPGQSQWNKIFAECFPPPYRRYWEDQGGSYNDANVTLLKISRVMETYHNRLLEDDPESDANHGSSSDSDSDSDIDDKKRKAKSNKHEKNKKSKSDNTSLSIDDYIATVPFTKPANSRICRLHGQHKWGECFLNPNGCNYRPRLPRSSGQGYQDGRGRGRGNGYAGRGFGSPAGPQQYYIEEAAQGYAHHPQEINPALKNYSQSAAVHKQTPTYSYGRY